MAIKCDQFEQWVIDPVLERLALPSPAEAMDMLLSIAASESLGCTYIDQHVTGSTSPGPAFGPFQFERLTITAVNKSVDRDLAAKGTMASVKKAFERFNTDYRTTKAETFHVRLDSATAYARLLLWFDPTKLPPVGDRRGQYELYRAVWRPGKPPTFDKFKTNREKWDKGTL